MLTFAVAALMASAQNNFTQQVTSGVVPECTLASSRSRSTLGYFGLSGEGPTEAFVRGSSGASGNFIDQVGDGAGQAIGYTRIRAEFVPCQGAVNRNYYGESRGWVRRMFAGLKADKTLTVRVSVDPDNVSKDSTLTRVSRRSSKSGDEWDTELVESAVLLPYFLVGQSTVIKIAPSFVASSDYNSLIAGDVMDIAERAAALINPAATLITSENKDRFNKATNFVDSTINGLLHRRVGEQAVSARVPHHLASGGEIARILLLAPGANMTVSSAATQPVGVWIVRADPMIRSLFGKQNQDGKLLRSTLSAAAILGYSVAEGRTLRDALLGKNAVSVARDAYLQAQAADKEKTGAQFCNVVSMEAARIGLSPADVGGAVWAMAADAAPAAAANAALLNACSTTAYIPV